MLNKRRICSFCAEELAPTSYYRHLHDRFGHVCPDKRQCVGLCDKESKEDVVSINSPKNFDSSFDVATSDEVLEGSC